MCLDSAKLASDDSYITIDHVIFLVSKIRSFLLKQKYSDIRKEVPQSNYQTICLNLIPTTSSWLGKDNQYLKSTERVPSTLSIGTTTVHPEDFYVGTYITYVSKERMRYVGNNKWLKNFIYATIGPDNYLYLNSANPQFLYLESLYITGIFENPREIHGLTNSSKCGFEDSIYPLEEALIPAVIELVVKELSVPRYSPEDNINNAKDDLAEVKQSK
jgi:hypothetical protein